MAYYVCLMVKAVISLPMGEDQLVPFVTEVFPLVLTSHASIYPVFYSLTFICSLLLPFVLQALQKICLADHIHSLAELLNTDAMQQLEDALLASLVANLIDIFSVGLQFMPSI